MLSVYEREIEEVDVPVMNQTRCWGCTWATDGMGEGEREGRISRIMLGRRDGTQGLICTARGLAIKAVRPLAQSPSSANRWPCKLYDPGYSHLPVMSSVDISRAAGHAQ